MYYMHIANIIYSSYIYIYILLYTDCISTYHPRPSTTPPNPTTGYRGRVLTRFQPQPILTIWRYTHWCVTPHTEATSYQNIPKKRGVAGRERRSIYIYIRTLTTYKITQKQYQDKICPYLPYSANLQCRAEKQCRLQFFPFKSHLQMEFLMGCLEGTPFLDLQWTHQNESKSFKIHDIFG